VTVITECAPVIAFAVLLFHCRVAEAGVCPVLDLNLVPNVESSGGIILQVFLKNRA
jgi:hypothetical protein